MIPEINFEALLDRSAKELKKAKTALEAASANLQKNAKCAVKKASDIKTAICAEIRDDIEAVKQRDPAAKSNIEILLLYSGVHAILAYRVAHKLYLSKRFFSARCVSQLARKMTGIEIHPGATIGKSFFIDHGMGVVIGETTEIGDGCTVYQGVTLGGTGKDIGKRHPTLGNNVMVGAGAKVLGPVRIGNNTKIAAGAVVLREIPDDSTAVGIPAKVVRKSGRKPDDLDQIHIPDPVAKELCSITQKIGELEKKIEELQK